MNVTVTAQWLYENQNLDNLVILDASLKSTADGASSNYHRKTIPEARYFDIKNEFSGQESKFPNTVPSAEQFQEGCRKLGINRSSKIVVYDNMGVYASPRVWWLFRAMGHDNIAVLDGGLPEWDRLGYPMVDKKVDTFALGNFTSQFDTRYVASYDDIKHNVKTKDFLIVDARSEGRYNGTTAEPRKHLQSGRIPHSVNIPYKEVLRDGRFKSVDELKALFSDLCEDEQKLVFSCGSGLTACIVMMASEIASRDSRTVYDGSWTEWAEKEGLIV